MKKRILSLILIIAVMLSGCSSKDDKEVIKHNYEFSGESEHWSANLKYDAKEIYDKKEDGAKTYSNEYNETLVVTYKGELSELSKLKHLEIEYEGKTGGGKHVADYDEGEGPISLSFTLSGGGKGGALKQEDDIIKVTVNMDGVIESFEIKNKN